jgi:predicted RNase H-like nuclease (RuvC/YqgF family)
MIVLCVIIAAESISRIKIKKMSKEIEDLKSDMKSKMKSKQEEHDEHISAKDKEISNVKLQLDGKENEVSVLSTVIEGIIVYYSSLSLCD